MSALIPFLACPFCAQQQASGTSSLLVLAFLAVPFAVGALVFHVIRSTDT